MRSYYRKWFHNSFHVEYDVDKANAYLDELGLDKRASDGTRLLPNGKPLVLNVYSTLRKEGTQKNVVDTMQTRAELYEFLGYHEYEQKLDQLFAGSEE